MARAKKKILKQLQTKRGRNKMRAANQKRVLSGYDSGNVMSGGG